MDWLDPLIVNPSNESPMARCGVREALLAEDARTDE
jgi:hypothetical protein